MAQESDWFPPMMHMDLVCGQILDRDDALGPVLHEGEQYYFCSSRCQSHFLRRTKPVRKKVKAVILPFPLEPCSPQELPLEANAF
jgi:YHS domain-containing protein